MNNIINSACVGTASENLNIEVKWRINEGGLVWLPPPPHCQSQPAQGPTTIIVTLQVISYMNVSLNTLYTYIFVLSDSELSACYRICNKENLLWLLTYFELLKKLDEKVLKFNLSKPYFHFFPFYESYTLETKIT